MEEFTNEDVKKSFDLVLKSKDIKLSYVKRGSVDFFSEPSEQNLYVVYGDRKDFENIMTFWIKSIDLINSKDSEDLDYFQSKSSKVKIDFFFKEYSWINNLLKRPLIINEEILDSFHCINEWNEQAFILKSNEKIILYYWYTTA